MLGGIRRTAARLNTRAPSVACDANPTVAAHNAIPGSGMRSCVRMFHISSRAYESYDYSKWRKSGNVSTQRHAIANGAQQQAGAGRVAPTGPPTSSTGPISPMPAPSTRAATAGDSRDANGAKRVTEAVSGSAASSAAAAQQLRQHQQARSTPSSSPSMSASSGPRPRAQSTSSAKRNGSESGSRTSSTAKTSRSASQALHRSSPKQSFNDSLTLLNDTTLVLLNHSDKLEGGLLIVSAIQKLKLTEAPFNIIIQAKELERFLDAIAYSLERHTSSWEPRHVGRVAQELTHFAKSCGLPKQQQRFFELPAVRHAMKNLTLAFVPKIDRLLPANLTGICTSLARAGIRYEPVFRAVAAWLVAIDTAADGHHWTGDIARSSSSPAPSSNGTGSSSQSSGANADDDFDVVSVSPEVRKWAAEWPEHVHRFWRHCDRGRERGLGMDEANGGGRRRVDKSWRNLARAKQQGNFVLSPLDGTPASVILDLLWCYAKLKWPVKHYAPFYAHMLRRLLLSDGQSVFEVAATSSSSFSASSASATDAHSGTRGHHTALQPSISDELTTAMFRDITSLLGTASSASPAETGAAAAASDASASTLESPTAADPASPPEYDYGARRRAEAALKQQHQQNRGGASSSSASPPVESKTVAAVAPVMAPSSEIPAGLFTSTHSQHQQQPANGTSSSGAPLGESLMMLRAAKLASCLSMLEVPLDRTLLAEGAVRLWLDRIARRDFGLPSVNEAETSAQRTAILAAGLDQGSFPELCGLAMAVALRHLTTAAPVLEPRHSADALSVLVSLNLANTHAGSAALAAVLERTHELLTPQELAATLESQSESRAGLASSTASRSFVTSFSPSELAVTLSSLACMARHCDVAGGASSDIDGDGASASNAGASSIATSVRVSCVDDMQKVSARRVDRHSGVYQPEPTPESDSPGDADGEIDVIDAVDVPPPQVTSPSADPESMSIAAAVATVNAGSSSGSGSDSDTSPYSHQGYDSRIAYSSDSDGASSGSAGMISYSETSSGSSSSSSGSSSSDSDSDGSGLRRRLRRLASPWDGQRIPLSFETQQQMQLLFTLSREAVLANLQSTSPSAIIQLLCAHAAVGQPLQPLVQHVCKLVSASLPTLPGGSSNAQSQVASDGDLHEDGASVASPMATMPAQPATISLSPSQLVDAAWGIACALLPSGSHGTEPDHDVFLSQNSENVSLSQSQQAGYPHHYRAASPSSSSSPSPRAVLCQIADFLASALDDLANLRPDQLSSLLWSLASTGVYHEPLVLAASDRLLTLRTIDGRGGDAMLHPLQFNSHGDPEISASLLAALPTNCELRAWPKALVEQLCLSLCLMTARPSPVRTAAVLTTRAAIESAQQNAGPSGTGSSSPTSGAASASSSTQQQLQQPWNQASIDLLLAASFSRYLTQSPRMNSMVLTTLAVADGGQQRGVRHVSKELADGDGLSFDQLASTRVDGRGFAAAASAVAPALSQSAIRLHNHLDTVLRLELDNAPVIHNYSAVNGSIRIDVAVPSHRIAVIFDTTASASDQSHAQNSGQHFNGHAGSHSHSASSLSSQSSFLASLPPAFTTSMHQWQRNIMVRAGWNVVVLNPVVFMGASGVRGKVRCLESAGLRLATSSNSARGERGSHGLSSTTASAAADGEGRGYENGFGSGNTAIAAADGLSMSPPLGTPSTRGVDGSPLSTSSTASATASTSAPPAPRDRTHVRDRKYASLYSTTASTAASTAVSAATSVSVHQQDDEQQQQLQRAELK